MCRPDSLPRTSLENSGPPLRTKIFPSVLVTKRFSGGNPDGTCASSSRLRPSVPPFVSLPLSDARDYTSPDYRTSPPISGQEPRVVPVDALEELRHPLFLQERLSSPQRLPYFLDRQRFEASDGSPVFSTKQHLFSTANFSPLYLFLT